MFSTGAWEGFTISPNGKRFIFSKAATDNSRILNLDLTHEYDLSSIENSYSLEYENTPHSGYVGITINKTGTKMYLSNNNSASTTCGIYEFDLN